MINLIKLKEILNTPLPGVNAHRLMAPSSRQMELNNVSQHSPKMSSVLLLLYKKQNIWYIPFIQRPVYNGFHSGQVSLPGGKNEKGDSSHLFTALRETREEIGVNPENINIIGNLTPLYIPKSNYNVFPFVGTLDTPPHFVADPKEVDDIIEVPLNNFLNHQSVKTFTYKRGNHTFSAPYYDAHGKKIWGATAMIIREFIELIKKI